MLIIVEGPDGSGKTTFVQEFRDWLKDQSEVGPVWTLHSAIRCKSIRDYEPFQDWLEHRPKNGSFILDRFPIISESVYGPVLRQRFFDEAEVNWTHLRNYLERLHPLTIVYCRPPAKLIREGLEISPQMKGVAKNIVPLTTRYDETMARIAQDTRMTPVLTYDRTRVKATDFYKMLARNMPGVKT